MTQNATSQIEPLGTYRVKRDAAVIAQFEEATAARRESIAAVVGRTFGISERQVQRIVARQKKNPDPR